MKRLTTLLASTMLVFASTAAHAGTRPQTTQFNTAAFGIVADDDYIGEAEFGWMWAGVGVLLGLGLIILIDGGEPNSPV